MKRQQEQGSELDDILNSLQFSEENLVKAAREQPVLFMRASRYRVTCMRRHLQAEAEYDRIVASVSRIIREQRADKNKKVTEKLLQERVMVHPKVIEARAQLDKTSVREEYSRLLVEAFRQRRDVCRILAEILWAEQNAEVRKARVEQETRGMGRLRRELDAKFPGRERNDD